MAKFLDELVSDCEYREKLLDVKGWVRAMRRLSVYFNWREFPPASIPVLPEFYDRLVYDRLADGHGWNEVAPLSGHLFFRGVLIHPEVVLS